MADVGVWIKNANIQARCGANANTTAKAVAATDVYVLDVENFINVESKVNWSTLYASLPTGTKYLLMDVGACICAMYVIQWDMSGFTSRMEAQTMLDVLNDRANKGLLLLKEKQYCDFVIAGA